MRKIAEVLRLKAAGMSVRQIASSTNAGRTAVGEYLARAEAAGIGWPLPEGLDEEALEAKLFPPPGDDAPARPVPDWSQIHKELRSRRHVTLRLVLQPRMPTTSSESSSRRGTQPVPKPSPMTSRG